MNGHTTEDEPNNQATYVLELSSGQSISRKGPYGEEHKQIDDETQVDISDGSAEIKGTNENDTVVYEEAKGRKDTPGIFSEKIAERTIDGCDDGQMEMDDITTIDLSCLDWNRVFRFLANHLDAGKCLLFFNTLYGNTNNRGEMNFSTKYKQVENDTKLRLGVFDTVTLLVEQFKAWKEYAGRHAKHTVISKSLQELDLNDTFDKFQRFMCKPPMLLSRREDEYYITDDDLYSSDHNFDVVPIPMGRSPLHIKRTFYALEHSGYYQDSRKAPDGVPDDLEMSSIFQQRHQPSIRQSEQFQTEEMSTNETLVPDDEPVYCVCREKKGGSANDVEGSNLLGHCQTYLSMTSFLVLIKTFALESKEYLRHDMYHILLLDTISKVKTETDKPKDIVLSLKYKDYLDAEKLKTKKETIAVMYLNEMRLVLGDESFSDLCFYVDYARKQVIDRLGRKEEDKDYLFLDYGGNRVYPKCFLSKATEEMNSTNEIFVHVQDTSTTTMEQN